MIRSADADFIGKRTTPVMMFEDDDNAGGGRDVSGSEVIIAESQNSMPNEIH